MMNRKMTTALMLTAGLIGYAAPGTPDLFAASSVAETRIVGGNEAESGSYPWMVALVNAASPSAYHGQFCGGTLVTPEWVVTAAHCVEGERPNQVDVVLDIHNLREESGERLEVSEIIVHPDYSTHTMDNDIALLHLASSASQEPISMVTGDNADELTAEGVLSTVIGWGNTQGTGQANYPDALQEVQVPLVTNDACNNGYNGQITDNMLCAGYDDGGKDSCSGDSGGPLMVPASDGSFSLAGVVSWGYGCAMPDYYGVYTRVSMYDDWMDGYLGDAEPVAAEITRPAVDDTLKGTEVTFTWDNVGADYYELDVGSSEGGYDIYGGSQTTETRLTVSDLPEDGSTVYTRLYSVFGEEVLTTDATFTAYTASAEGSNVAIRACFEIADGREIHEALLRQRGAHPQVSQVDEDGCITFESFQRDGGFVLMLKGTPPPQN
ncbi:MAG: serine protease [Magnetococcales bacterium]|nr:serine protease [Magnetococcales bacterium]